MSARQPCAEAPNLESSRSAGEAAHSALSERWAGLCHWQADVLHQAEPEAVHQLRVSARRLCAALTVFAPLLHFSKRMSAGPFRRVERRFGALRDLDVEEGLLRAEPVPGSDDTPPSHISQALRDLEEGRRDAWGRALRSLRRRRYQLMSHRLGEWLQAPQLGPIGRLPLQAVAPDLLLPSLARVLLEPGWASPFDPPPDSPEAAALHALRRRIKALRYSVECLAGWYGPRVEAWLTELHAIQDALGSWHDQGMLLSRLESAGAPDELIAAARARARDALEPWPAWRARYADPKFRATLRALLQGEPRIVPHGATTETPQAAEYSPPARGKPSLVVPDPLPIA